MKTARRSRFTTTRLLERSSLSPSRVDREAGVIRGVKVLGRNSSNGRRYSPDAIRSAVRLYEGASVRVDHPANPEAQRNSDSVFGWLRGVRQADDGCLYADLHYLKTHPLAERICEAAERNPRLYGLSHNAEGKVEVVDGEAVVMEICDLRSVDIVADPATTQGLFESKQPRGKHPMKLREWFDRTRLLPPVRKTIKRLFEAGYMDDMTMPEADLAPAGEEPPAGADTEPESSAALPGSDPADMDPTEALRKGFRTAIMAVVDDTTMSVKDKLKRIGKLVKTGEELYASGEDIPEEDRPDDTSETESSGAEETVAEAEECAGKKKGEEDITEEDDDMSEKKVNESVELSRLRAEKHARTLCVQNGLPAPSETLLEALAGLDSDQKRLALIEENRPARKAKSAAGLTEGKGTRPTGSTDPRTTDDVVAILQGRAILDN